MREERNVEDQMAVIVKDDSSVKRIMSIPGKYVYSATAVIAEIDDISRVPIKEKLESYAGLTPRQNQSDTRNITGHITKYGPSMLRFILVNAAHTVIKHSTKMMEKYNRLVRGLGRNRAIVAISRILLETIYVMLRKDEDYIDQNEALTE